MKERVRNKRGITLIALIITVVVMLILAGVAIAAVVDGEGLFSKTRQAVDTYENAQKEEGEKIQSMINEIDKYLGNNTETEEETLVEAFKAGKIHVGDYITNYNDTLKNKSDFVNIEEEESGVYITQTYRVDTNTTWRVLGLDESGTQLIITTGSPLRRYVDPEAGEEVVNDPYFYLRGAEGYYHTNDELTDDNILDRICSIYDSKFAESTKSMRIDDINMLLGLEVDKENNKLYKKDDRSTELPFEGYFGLDYVYQEDDTPFENYLKEKYPENQEYQALESKEAGDSVEGSAYMYIYSEDNPLEEPPLSVIDSKSKLYEILFDKTTDKDGCAKAYWLASSGVGVRPDEDCGFGPGAVYYGYALAGGYYLFYSRGVTPDRGFAVRPVVYLQSNVTVKDLTISSQGSEPDWEESPFEPELN